VIESSLVESSKLVAAEMARIKDFMCDLKLEGGCDKSIARMWLVKTENPSMCETVNWKVCKSMIALYCLYSELWKCIRCNKSNHPIQNPSYKSSISMAIQMHTG
jgi:hypothetical protein